MAAGPTLTEKFQGCLVGGLLGDCLGAPFEAHIKNTVIPDQRTFFQNLLKGEVAFGPLAGRNFRPSEVDQEHGEYHYTDDSAMTFCLARSLLAKGGFDPLDVAKRFTGEYFENQQLVQEYGNAVKNVFQKWKDSSYADPYKPAMEQFEGRGSYGNGASMRVAPVALFYTKDHEKMIEVARNQAKLTHSNESAYNAAILQCMAIATALRSDPGTPFDSGHFMSHLVALMLQQEKSHNGQGPLCCKMELIKKIVRDPTQDPTPAEVAVMLGNDMSAQGSVPTAIYSFLRSQRPLADFEHKSPYVRCLYFAIACGGDSDTIAAMAGNIAGARHGISSIPGVLQRQCKGVDEMARLAESIEEAVFK
ncbi:ADP-ribose glycohydrolase ARH3 [Ixodes scapularis]